MRTHDKPHLELLQGGLRDFGDEDWHAFCQRIGWQETREPSLPDDYEDQLVAKIFGRQRETVVLLPAPRPRAQRRSLRWLAAAAIAAGIAVALLSWYRADTPTADTVPTPVPEVTQRPLTPPPERALPKPHASEPDPGARHARVAPAPRPVAEAPPVEPPPPAAAATISPDAAPAVHLSSRMPPGLVAVHTDPPRDYALTETVPRMPLRHLAMAAPAAGSHAVALVDVFAAARQLSEL